MIARSGALRAAINRRIQFKGDYTNTLSYVVVPFHLAQIVKSTKSKSDEDLIKAGSILQFESTTMVKAYDRAIILTYPKALYSMGMVSGMSLIVPEDDAVRPACQVLLTVDVTQAELDAIQSTRIFVEGE